jgi:hypothetical protein
MASGKSFFRRHKFLSTLGILFVVLVLSLAGFLAWRMYGPYRSYKLDFVNAGTGAPGMLEVGVARRDITPNLALYDIFNDVDKDNKYRPSTGLLSHIEAAKGPDTYDDRNGNRKFDPVWMAGFGNDRPAKGVHDPIWARAVAFRNNGVTVAMVTLDAIGMFHEKIIDIRKRIDPALKIDHVIVACLHNHETPDTMGNWSGLIPSPWSFDYENMERVKNACKEAVEEAVKNLQPAEMQGATCELNPEGFVTDTRKPIVIDTKLNCVRFTRPGTDVTIATLVNWSNHPEALGGNNPHITSDFCGYWREGVEQGVPEPNGVKGLGGMCLYFQGMVGGLATPLDVEVPHRDGVHKFKEDSFEKAEALGQNLAIKTVNVLHGAEVWKEQNPRVAVAAKTVYFPVSGLFKYAIALGLVHPGVFWPFNARTEVDVVRVGDLEILTVPGELYPEIADGGVESPQGADFHPLAPVEVPPLRRDVMNGRMRMVFGLANDEIGYIIPKSQFDAAAPHAYEPDGQYGEENSGGPGVAPVIHHEAMALLNRMHEALKNTK